MRHHKETLGRSVAKTLAYRLMIIAMDFVAVYLFTGKVKIALGFMLVSNLYTTVAYFIHERIWNGIHWGKTACVTVKASL